jgi:hypothetical protein
MKKLLIILVVSLLIDINAFAKTYKVNDIVENQFYVNKKFVIDLPKGKWILAEKSPWFYYGLRTTIYVLLKLENKKVIEMIEVAEMHTAGIYEYVVNQAIFEALFKNKYDGCYERPEYSILRFYVKGSTHNCFLTGHADVYKELFTPEDPEQKTANAKLRRYITQNQIQLPKVGLFSNHFYFSRLRAGKWYALSYAIDPQILGAPANKFITEDSSEYHKNNIDNYPEHKKIMKKWISLSARRHIEFEESVRALKRHRLNLNDLSPKKIIDDNNNQSNNMVDQLQKLNDLFNSGILTKEEFEKAKKKILN